MPRPRILAASFSLFAIAAVAVAFLPRLAPPTFHGTDLGAASQPYDFALEAAHGGSLSLSDFRGRVVLLFFGYTSCPDVCPMTMSRLREVVDRLGARGEDVQVLLVTVDPDVDTAATLDRYVKSFDPAFMGLRGDRKTLAEVAASFGAWAGEADPGAAPAPAPAAGHEHHAPEAAAPRMIPHTSHVFGIDRDGRYRVLWSPDMTADQVTADVRELLRR